jgi:hypothetical protein
MSDLYFTGSGLIQLPAGSALCTLALKTATAGPRITLPKIAVFFNGTSTSATPVTAQICRITNTPNGTPLGSSYGPNCQDDAGPASVAIATAYTASGATPGVWTTAPTSGAVLWEGIIPPTTGLPEWYPLAQEVKVGVNKWFGVFLTAPAAVGAYTHLVHYE